MKRKLLLCGVAMALLLPAIGCGSNPSSSPVTPTEPATENRNEIVTETDNTAKATEVTELTQVPTPTATETPKELGFEETEGKHWHEEGTSNMYYFEDGKVINVQLTAQNEAYFNENLLNNYFLSAESEGIFFGPKKIAVASSEDNKIYSYSYTINEVGLVLTDNESGEIQVISIEGEKTAFVVMDNEEEAIKGEYFAFNNVRRPYYKTDRHSFEQLYSRVKNEKIAEEKSRFYESPDGSW